MFNGLKYHLLFLYPEWMPWGLGFFRDPEESWVISASPDSNTGYESAETEIIQDSPDEWNHSEGKLLLKVLQ